MFLATLPEDLILHIMQNPCLKNKDMIAFIRISKNFLKLGKKVGYIKSIIFGMHTDYMNFVQLYNRRNFFLRCLTMENMDNPALWIPKKWPKEIFFNRCHMGNKLIDPPASPTETLVIRDLERHHNYNTIKINWSKIPNLKIIDIYAADLDFTGLECCKKLEVIRIDLTNSSRKLPLFVANLQNLSIIAVSCKTTEAMNFLSKKLKICFVPKIKKFSSSSNIVPEKHLSVTSEYINLQSIFLNLDELSKLFL